MVSPWNHHAGDDSVSDFYATGATVRGLFLCDGLNHPELSDLADCLSLPAHIRGKYPEESPELFNQK